MQAISASTAANWNTIAPVYRLNEVRSVGLPNGSLEEVDETVLEL